MKGVATADGGMLAHKGERMNDARRTVMAVDERAVVVWEPIAWCTDCEWYLPAEDAGTRCPGDDCKRILRRRLARICRRCEEHPAFLSPHGDDYDKHQVAVHEEASR